MVVLFQENSEYFWNREGAGNGSDETEFPLSVPRPAIYREPPHINLGYKTYVVHLALLLMLGVTHYLAERVTYRL